MSRIIVHTHGKIKNKSVKLLISSYLERITSESVKLIHHSEGLSPKDYLQKLIKNSEKGELILLDERGTTLNSISFANLLKSWKLNPKKVHLAIGPATGFPKNNFEKISLSNLTLPNEIASMILIEQIYRSIQIIKGTKYHK